MQRTLALTGLLLGLFVVACAPTKRPSHPQGTPAFGQPSAPAARPTSSAVRPSPTVNRQAFPSPTATGECPSGTGQTTSEAPIYNHRVYLTTSPDGRTFAEGQLILEHASMPDLTVGPDGAPWVYFVNGEPARHGIFVARPTSDGAWEVVGCVTLDGAFNGNAVDPDIIRLPDGRYRLVYFQGNFVSRSVVEGEPNPIFSAVSHDGLHFTVERQIFAYPGATDPSLVQLPDGTWLLAVLAEQRIIFARSQDGQSFHEFGQPIVSPGIPELFVFADGSVGLYLGRTFYLSADGGQTWQEQAARRGPGGGGSVSLLAQPQGGYLFVYLVAQPAAGGAAPPPAPGEEQGSRFNPFAALTAEQEACLKSAWGEAAFQAISTFRRPPTQEEAPALEACGVRPPKDEPTERPEG